MKAEGQPSRSGSARQNRVRGRVGRSPTYLDCQNPPRKRAAMVLAPLHAKHVHALGTGPDIVLYVVVPVLQSRAFGPMPHVLLGHALVETIDNPIYVDVGSQRLSGDRFKDILFDAASVQKVDYAVTDDVPE